MASAIKTLGRIGGGSLGEPRVEGGRKDDVVLFQSPATWALLGTGYDGGEESVEVLVVLDRPIGLPGQHGEGEHPEGIDVALGRHPGLSVDLLRRDVEGRAEDALRDGLGVHYLGDAEVENLHLKTFVAGHDVHVLGLEVAMDDASTMGLVERSGHLRHEPKGCDGGELTALQEDGQLLTLEQLHYEIGQLRLGLDARVVGVNDEGAVQAGRDHGFTLESQSHLLGGEGAGEQHLEGYERLVFGPAGGVDGPHGPPTDHALDTVRAEGVACAEELDPAHHAARSLLQAGAATTLLLVSLWVWYNGGMTVPVSLLTPCAGTTLAWHFQGKLHLTTVVKATFTLPPTGTMSLAAPLPIYDKDQTFRNRPTSSVVGPSDRAPMKQRADVTLSGRAYARFGTEATSTQVRLSILRGNRLLLNKTLRIRGDEGGQLPFATMDVSYERAFGGVGFELNPIGTGVGDGDPPNIVYPSNPEVPAGYAPVPAIWPVRKKRLRMKRKALYETPVELPADFDWAYFQAAPSDQQTTYLEGDETVELDGLHPDAMRASVSLPSARAVGAVYGPKEGRQLLGFVADAFHLEPDERRCTVTWRSVIEVTDASHLASMLVAVGVAIAGHSVEIPVQKPKGATVTAPAPAGGPFDGEGTVTMAGSRKSGQSRTLKIDDEQKPTSSLGAPFSLARGATSSRKPVTDGTPWSTGGEVESPKPDQRHTLALPPEARDAIVSSRRTASSVPSSVIELDDAEILSARPEELSESLETKPVPAARAQLAPRLDTKPAQPPAPRLDQTTVSPRSRRPVEAPSMPHARGGRLDPAREQLAEAQARKRANPRFDLREALYRDFV